MDIFEAIQARRSVRQFDEAKGVSDEVLNKIVEAGIMAPSAGNGQSWHFVVVRDEQSRRRLATEAGHQLFIRQAPAVIVVCADLELAEKGYGIRGRDTYALQETAAAIENMLLAVTALGLASCWVGAFDEDKAREILDLPKNFRPVAMLPIGAPAENVKRVPPRRRLSDVITRR
jgi:nitroreductase